MEEANVVRIFTLVFSPGWWHPPAGLSLDCLRHEESPHQPLVVGEGSLGVVGDGRYTGTGVFPEACWDGPGHCLPFEHLAVQAPGVDQHRGHVVSVRGRKKKRII